MSFRSGCLGVLLALVFPGCAPAPPQRGPGAAAGPEPIARAWPVMGTMLEVRSARGTRGGRRLR